MTDPIIKLETKDTGAVGGYQIIAKSESKDVFPDFYYIDPQTGEQHKAVMKGNKLFTQGGIELCTIHGRGTKPKPKLNRHQRRSKK